MQIAATHSQEVETYLALGRDAQARLLARGLGQYVPAAHPENWPAIRGRVRAGTLWTVHDAGEAGAFFALDAGPSRWWPDAEASALYLSGVVVSPAWKGRGVGEMIVRWCAAEAARQGRSALRLDCHASNPWLADYYERLGFQRRGIVSQHPGYDGRLMELPVAPRPAVVDVRAATDGDWPNIWPIFRAVVAAGDTYAFAPDTSESEARRLWTAPPASAYVASDGGEVVGTYFLRPVQPGLGSHVANAGFMVAPGSSGRGVGRAMGRHCLAEARRRGFSAMQFNFVVSSNERAVRLWQSLGFATVGTVPGAFRHAVHGPVAVHIMHREL